LHFFEAKFFGLYKYIRPTFRSNLFAPYQHQSAKRISATIGASLEKIIFGENIF